MERDRVIQIKREGNFTLEEAQELLPIVKKITREARTNIDLIMLKLDGLPEDEHHQLLNLVGEHMKIWEEKIKKLGAQEKGACPSKGWFVDFNSGDGYFCWRDSEEEISHWHPYDGGNTNRISIEEWKKKSKYTRIKKVSPEINNSDHLKNPLL